MPQTKLYDKNSFKKFRRLAQKPASPMAKIRRSSTKNLIETAIKFKIQEPRDKELITHFFKPKIKTSLSKLPQLLVSGFGPDEQFRAEMFQEMLECETQHKEFESYHKRMLAVKAVRDDYDDWKTRRQLAHARAWAIPFRVNKKIKKKYIIICV